MAAIILVAGATGNLGLRITKALCNNNAQVRAIVRPSSEAAKITTLENLGVQIYKVDDWTVEEIKVACEGVSCVVSVLAGLREVVIDAQKVLLDAAIAAGVPRFIPSDYSLDFTNFSPGENRNLDLRREFHKYLDQTSIASTSIFNGAFADLLVEQMPFILTKKKMVIYWGNKDRRWAFTTMDNTAEYTAKVALDPSTPRYLRIAGDQISPRKAREIACNVYGKKFTLLRLGSKGLLGFIIKIARFFNPAKNELYPAWQGMQYMHNMIDERSKIEKLDNKRYPEIKWTTVKQVLEQNKVTD